MEKRQIYYKSKKELEMICRKIKNSQCPFCNVVGCLILHGFLYGYHQTANSGRTKKGKRFFCCNRGKRKGCGRTFSILFFIFIKRFNIQTDSIWRFLNNIAQGMSKKAAFNTLQLSFCDSAAYRLFNKFRSNQIKIRDSLCNINGPPESMDVDPLIQLIKHLKLSFKNSLCPVASFQYKFQTTFL